MKIFTFVPQERTQLAYDFVNSNRIILSFVLVWKIYVFLKFFIAKLNLMTNTKD